jgi:hypothetical protein
MLSLSNDNGGVGDIKEEREGARTLLNESRRFLGVLHVNSIYL